MEKDPAEHVHALVQRAPQMRQQAHREPPDGPQRRAAPHWAPGGAVPEENVPKVQPEAHLPPDAAGERVRCAGVPGQGEHQAGVHRWVQRVRAHEWV